MSIILSVVLSLFLILGGPGILVAKTGPKETQKGPKVTQPIQDLETAAADLQENIKDLRHNIHSWQKIHWDAKLPPEERKKWRTKADGYLQECEAYNDLLTKVDAKKLPKSEASRRFLDERQTFQRELQNLRQVLQLP
jgi:hypothetical protein